MNELDVLELLSTTSSTTAKAKILQENKSNKKLIQLLEAAYDYKRKFYVNKIDGTFTSTGTAWPDLHSNFLQLLTLLETRAIVGNEAKTEVSLFLLKCDDKQRKWYTRIIRKDLKAGIATDEVAKIASIPVFDVQLAKDGKSCKKAEEIISKGVYLSPKFDGYRCLAVIENNTVTLFSRNGTVYQNFPTIEHSLLESFPNESLVLDGEIMSDDFQSMQKSAFASKRGTTVGDVRFHVFDCLRIEEWNALKFKDTKAERYARLEAVSGFFPPNVVIVKQDVVYTLDEVLKAEQAYLLQGYEGAMTCPDIPYYLGKSSNKLLKWKTMVSEDCEIVGFYEGKEDTRNKGRLGGFVLKQEDGQECECGTGFSDEDREYIWANQGEFLGRTIEVKYQEKSNHGIMRFPVFIRYRDDKSSNK